MWIPIVLAGSMVLFLPFCIWAEYKWVPRKYLYTKLTSSLFFVLTGLASYIMFGAGNTYGLFIVVALLLGMIGDGFLVYDQNPKFFIPGLVSFLLGQFVYGCTFLNTNGLLWHDLFVYFAIIGISLFFYSKSDIEFGKMKRPVLLYYVIIIFMYTMAISSVYKGVMSPLAAIMVACGATLFIMSDIMLALNLFGKKKIKSLKAWVLVTYYFAQILFALSIIVI